MARQSGSHVEAVWQIIKFKARFYPLQVPQTV